MPKKIRHTVSKFKPRDRYDIKVMMIWVSLFAIIGVTALLLTKAATPGIAVTVDSSLPNPTNVRVYPDDRTVTVVWDEPANAAGKNIVGYYVTWGAQSKGTYTDAKQTIHTIAQIQPLQNGAAYNIKVQSVQGSRVNKPSWRNEQTGGDTFAVANGKVSSGATTTATVSSARVDQLRTQMTAFFDDFNQPEGAFDELKWNTATSACADLGESGAFLNNQFHTHNQIKSSDTSVYCDRAEMVSRARATFDITGRTEANPGIIVSDFDGVTQPRDFWYIDLVPLNARKNGVPLDLTSHNDAFDDTVSDPVMLRLLQTGTGLSLHYTDSAKRPIKMTSSGSCGGGETVDVKWCDAQPISGMSPLPEMPFVGGSGSFPVANVRQHWRIEVSNTRIKVFINTIKVLDSAMPSDLANIKQYAVQSNLFTYNTGKQFDTVDPSSSILHWDNFGFNGPAPTTVTHNYVEGGSTGSTPYMGRGTKANPIPMSPRTTKVTIPDPISAPVKARFMYTLQHFDYNAYNWSANDNITINGHKYALPNPTASEQAPVVSATNIDNFTPFADSISINPADLVQGVNTVAINVNGGGDMLNVHIELDYTKGSEPVYTQPQDIFTKPVFALFSRPALRTVDSYWFIEQDMGLPSGTLDGSGGGGGGGGGSDTVKPTVTLTAPTSTYTVANNTFTATATATDNIGVQKVEFFLSGALKGTGSASGNQYSATISTVGLNPGSYPLNAVATDTSGNIATSSPDITIIVPTPPDNTKPTVSIVSPTSGQTVSGSVLFTINASDVGSGVKQVGLSVDGGATLTTDSTNPYTLVLDSRTLSNGNHTVRITVTDVAGNTAFTEVVVSVSNNVGGVVRCDFNNSGTVDFLDLGIVLGNYNKSVTTVNTSGDCNGSKSVDFLDLGILLGQYNS